MRSTHGGPFPTGSWKSERGSITVPLLILSVVLSGAAISTLSYAMIWKSKCALQLRLDRCVEATALHLAEIQNRIEASNRRMRIERTAAAAAAGPSFGASLQAVKVILAAEMTLQEVQRTKWLAHQGAWLAERGCDRRSDRFLPLPPLHWVRPPPDGIGFQPLEWRASRVKLEIQIWKGNRFSQARVDGRDANSNGKKWQARWSKRLGQ